VNGEQVRDARFLTGDLYNAYDQAKVDDLLRRIAVELDAGRPAGPLIAGATFPRTRWSRGYDTGAVDWFLGQLLRDEDPSQSRVSADPWCDLAVANHFTRSGPGDLAERTANPSSRALREYGIQDRAYLAGECAAAWRDFEQLPGTHLQWLRTGAVRRELQLRTAEQQAIASGRYLGASRWRDTTTLTTGGKTFTWKPVTGSSWPDIAEIAARHAHDLELGYFLDMASLPRWDSRRAGRKPSRAQDLARGTLRELVDETGMPILHTGGRHLYEQAWACVTLGGQRWLRFPVRGTRRTNAIMTAVDQAGNNVARYRIGGQRRWSKVEIIVHPGQPLTDELVLAIAMSAPWLSSYFSHPNPA
jgi:DivIVA domain-containing protein